MTLRMTLLTCGHEQGTTGHPETAREGNRETGRDIQKRKSKVNRKKKDNSMKSRKP